MTVFHTGLSPELTDLVVTGKTSTSVARILSFASTASQQAIADYLKRNTDRKIDEVLALALRDADESDEGSKAVQSLLNQEATKLGKRCDHAT